MDIFDAIKGRRSVRYYQDRPVPGDVVQELLEFAVYAPSGSNRQPWRFALVEDRDLLKKWSDQAKVHVLAALPQRPGTKSELITSMSSRSIFRTQGA